MWGEIKNWNVKSSIIWNADRDVGIWKFMGGNVVEGVVELEESRRMEEGGEHSRIF